MGKLLIVNGSPRAPRSNSKKYAAIVRDFWSGAADEYSVTEKKHGEVCRRLDQYMDMLLVFPLYADGLPVTLMGFLKELEQAAETLSPKPTVHILINCGFLEPEQNYTAVDMLRIFCKKRGFSFGSVLCIGSGEAILGTPFTFLVKRKIRRLVQGIKTGKAVRLKVTMPLPKKVFIRASTKYWLALGAQSEITKDDMETMKIE